MQYLLKQNAFRFRILPSNSCFETANEDAALTMYYVSQEAGKINAVCEMQPVPYLEKEQNVGIKPFE